MLATALGALARGPEMAWAAIGRHAHILGELFTFYSFEAFKQLLAFNYTDSIVICPVLPFPGVRGRRAARNHVLCVAGWGGHNQNGFFSPD